MEQKDVSPSTCRATGCRAPWVFHGLCEYHADFEDHPEVWTAVTQMLYRPDVIRLRRALAHLGRVGAKQEVALFPEARDAAADIFGEDVVKLKPHPNPRFAEDEPETIQIWKYRMMNELGRWLKAQCLEEE